MKYVFFLAKLLLLSARVSVISRSLADFGYVIRCANCELTLLPIVGQHIYILLFLFAMIVSRNDAFPKPKAFVNYQPRLLHARLQ